MSQTSFAREILSWYEINKRDLPWRKTKDPYRIWLSEIILQQTRVNQGMPYYEKFLQEFPRINLLASAKEEKILRLWQGLGYYSRARNLHKAAKLILKKHAGIFPSTPSDILELPGVGEYTTAAISSFAFGHSIPVIDGNVERLLSRYFGIHERYNSSIGKKMFLKIAESHIKGNNPSIYNQAIMEFGSMQCTPQSPDCTTCPLSPNCFAFKKDLVSALPIKKIKTIRKKRFFNYLFIEQNSKFCLIKRTKKDIWENLYEFPMIESEKLTNEKFIYDSERFKTFFSNKKPKIKQSTIQIKHILSHQEIHARFWIIKTNRVLPKSTNIKMVANHEHSFPIPRLLEKFLESHLGQASNMATTLS